MKKLVVFAAAAFIAAPALAAELQVLKPVPSAEPYYSYYKEPPRPLAVVWTGCYLGGHVGGAFENNDFNNGPMVVTVTPPVPSPNPTTDVIISEGGHSFSSGNGVVGGQAGCNLELGSKWLVGVEADAAWTRITASHVETASTTIPGTPTSQNQNPGTLIQSSQSFSSRTDFIGTATARLGYELGYYNQGFVYGKGGVAWVINKYGIGGSVSVSSCTDITGTTPTCSGTVVAPFRFGVGTQTRVGWTIGAGIEWALVGGWSVKGEYDYMNFGRHTLTFTESDLGISCCMFPPTLGVGIKQEISEVKVGLNYLFGRPPVNLPGMW
jgi:outer membrane immunogenic protein